METAYVIIYFLTIILIVLFTAFLFITKENQELRKQLNKPKPKLMFTEIDPNKFIEMITGRKVQTNEEALFNERQFLIEELTKLKAKGWSEDSTIEELRNLYDLLQ